MLCRDTQPARLFVFLNGVILLRVLSPVPGEGIYYHLSGGYASLTPGYYHITPDGVSVRIPDGISAVETADSVVSETRESRVYTV